MELTKEQVKSFKEAGYVFIEDLFKLVEIVNKISTLTDFALFTISSNFSYNGE